jgi:hypothetical protein
MSSSLFDLSTTKKVCTFSTISIVLILSTMILPFNRIPFLSGLVKLTIVFLLCYTIYLNILQTNTLRNAISSSDEVASQLTVNIVSGYVFTVFLGLLALFVAKGMMV